MLSLPRAWVRFLVRERRVPETRWPGQKERKKERKKAACTGLLRAAMTLSAGLGSEDKQLIQANAMSSLLNGVLLTEVCRLMGFCAI